LIRVSIIFLKKVDCRVKPGNDLLEGLPLKAEMRQTGR
jgi:hypothetical protein